MIIAALVAGTRLCSREEGDKFGGGPKIDGVDAGLEKGGNNRGCNEV